MPGAVVLNFLVQGSKPDPYQVKFVRSSGTLTAFCSCPAGQAQQICKHRLRLLEGDVTALVSPNANDVPKLLGLLAGTPLGAAIREMDRAELSLEEARRDFSATKRAVAKVMNAIGSDNTNSNSLDPYAPRLETQQNINQEFAPLPLPTSIVAREKAERRSGWVIAIIVIVLFLFAIKFLKP